MSGSQPTLADRVAALEKTLRLWQGITACRILAVVVMFALSRRVQGEVRAKKVIIVGEDGRARVALGVTPDGGGVIAAYGNSGTGA
jgi:hypothetical protein